MGQDMQDIKRVHTVHKALAYHREHPDAQVRYDIGPPQCDVDNVEPMPFTTEHFKACLAGMAVGHAVDFRCGAWVERDNDLIFVVHYPNHDQVNRVNLEWAARLLHHVDEFWRLGILKDADH